MKQKHLFQKKSDNLIHLAITSLLAGSMLAALPAHAFQFQSDDGGVKGSFDTTVSFGMQFSTESRHLSNVAISNGGTSRAATNGDDGLLNFKSGDPISTLFKATHDLDVKYQNFGLFARGSYYYDETASNKNNPSFAASKSRLGSGGEILDAYVRAEGEVGGRKLVMRLGNQVINWGEGTFLPNSISSTSPLDLPRLRAPGAELKEALLPTPIFLLTQEITDSFTLEAYYQSGFRETRIDPRGSFFSTSDILSEGGDKIYAGIGRRFDNNSPLVPPASPPAATLATGAVGQAWMNRASDREPGNSGQYGISARLGLPSIDTELGFYYLVYHSRTPILSFVRGTPSSVLGQGSGYYFADYPENIQLYGLSFNTVGPAGIALQGEVSYRPNQPLQLPGTDLFLLAAGFPLTQFGAPPAVGTVIDGYKRAPMTQIQVTATKSFGPQFGAGQFVTVGEIGFTHINVSGGPFNGPGTGLPYLQAAASNVASGALGSAQPGGYLTSDSWGYRLAASLTYSNAIGAIGLTPRVAFAHDVSGIGPTFNEGTKALTLGVNFNYKQDWQADIAYTSFFGGRTFSGTDDAVLAANYVAAGQPLTWSTSANPAKDRDFLAISLSYSF